MQVKLLTELEQNLLVKLIALVDFELPLKRRI